MGAGFGNLEKKCLEISSSSNTVERQLLLGENGEE
jgi:hypothetical protein